MFHGMGWTMPFTALMLGTQTCFCGAHSTPKDQLELCLSEGVTVSGGVPTVYQQMRSIMQEDPARYKGKLKLNRVVCGGSAPPKELMSWYLNEYKIEMMQGWGMTETNPIGALSKMQYKRKHTTWTVEQQFENIQKPGPVVPIMQWKIVHPDDFSKELPHDGQSAGELLVRGVNVTGEYWRNPAAADKFYEGWLITGDIAKITPEEELVITDRSKDLIKSGGEWISSNDIENHIVALAGVAQACVVAVPHPKWDERPVAVVVRGQQGEVSSTAVLEHCRATFAKYEVPDDVLFWNEIPLTSTGKLDKKRVRQILADEGYELPSLRATSKL
jgi:fatty-acyl-CoA synthase